MNRRYSISAIALALVAMSIAVLLIMAVPVRVEISGGGYLAIEVNVAYAAGEDISNTPASYAFGIVEESSTSSTGLTYFTLTNNGVMSDITISGTDMSGGVGWTLSDTASPSVDTVGFKAGTWSPYSVVGFSGGDEQGSVGFSGGDEQDKIGAEGQGDYLVVVKKTASYNKLIYRMPANSSVRWGFKMYTPTSFSDGVQKTGTITLTATAS